jgi:hypothetical protein
LFGAKKGSKSSFFQVVLSKLETVCGLGEILQTLKCFRILIFCKNKTKSLLRASPNPASELMELS